MPRVITSPVKRWPGTVTLPDYLDYSQAQAFGEAVEAAQALGETTALRYRATMLPGLLACVQAWELGGGFDPARFPATPAQSAARLFAWLAGEVSALFSEADDVPLGSE